MLPHFRQVNLDVRTIEMKIKYSRHAKRRAKLYRISLADIESLLKSSKLIQGKQEIVK